MADAPEGIFLGRHRDLQGRQHQVWVRRVILAAIAVVPLLGLFNFFGQRPTDTQAAGQAATLSLSAPERARGGSSTRRISPSRRTRISRRLP